MLTCDLQRLVNTFTNGDARHNDNKFAPAIALIHLKDGFDVAICLTSTGFHFNIEINLRAGIAY